MSTRTMNLQSHKDEATQSEANGMRACAPMGILRLSQFQTLLAVLGSARTLDQLVESILRETLTIVDGNRGALAMVSHEGRELVDLRRTGHAGDERRGHTINSGMTPQLAALMTRSAVTVADEAERSARFPDDPDTEAGALLALPLLVGDRTLGVLSIGFAGSLSPDLDPDALRLIADICAQSFERVRALESERQTREFLDREICLRERAESALRESTRLFRELAETSPDVVLSWLLDGSCDYVSPRLYELTNLAPDSGPGEGWMQALHADDVPRLRNQLRDGFATTTPFECNFRMQTPWGGHRRFICRIHPVRDEAGQVIRWLGTASDVHDLWLAERSLHETRRHQDEFLAILSHELLNTLVPIQNAVELLRLPGIGAAQTERAAGIIDSQVRAFRRLIDDLQDASRIIRGKVELRRQAVELGDVLRVAVELSKPVLERWKHQLTVAPPERPIWLNADQARLAQALANLLRNAAQFTKEGGRVRLAAELNGGEAAIRVEDNGVGIDPELLPRIFDLFVRSDDTLGRAQRGLGIGLAVVRKIVEMHGGRVQACSAGAEQGSTFMVQLPALSDEQRLDISRLETSSSPTPPASRRILMIADDQACAEEWCMLLRVAGHEVRTAVDLSAALGMAKTFRPHVVFLDLGVIHAELVRQLRQTPELCEATLVALVPPGTASVDGCDCVLTKPVKIKDCLQRVTQPRKP
jgi:PAS domain S-box-containing protein